MKSLKIFYPKINHEHKLSKKWTLYFDTFTLHNSYLDFNNFSKWKIQIDNVYSFNTIENFWKLYNNINPPSDIWQKSAYYLFSTEISNKSDINFIIMENNNKNYVNDIWLKCLLLLIGNNIIYQEYISGISLKCEKKYFILEMYLSDNTPEICKKEIKEFIKIELNV